jgi:endonuclease G
MKRIFLFLFLFRLSCLFPCDLPGHFNFVVSNSNEELLYSGCYDAIHKGPHITEYALTKERIESKSVRRPHAIFRQDRDGGRLQELLNENGYELPHHGDYYDSGYDRGHMAPNADFNDTRENALLTFFIANIWPQKPAVNRVTWLRTEEETRRLAVEYLIIKVIIIVDEFNGETVEDIHVPLFFKRKVYDAATDELIYEIDVYQETETD